MKLSVMPRAAEKKGEVNRIRREGNIPAIIYSGGKPGDKMTVTGPDFDQVIRSIEKGSLPTQMLILVDSDGKERRAIVKDIQYHVTTYQVIHLDFEELHDDVLVSVNVPIVFSGARDCVGVKLGGVLRQVIRHLRVRCLPKNIPASFTMEVQDLDVRQSRRLSALTIPETVRPLMNLNTVAVTIAKKR